MLCIRGTSHGPLTGSREQLLRCGLRKFCHSKSSVYRWYPVICQTRIVMFTLFCECEMNENISIKNAYTVVNWLSGKLVHLMPSDVGFLMLKCTKFAVGCCCQHCDIMMWSACWSRRWRCKNGWSVWDAIWGQTHECPRNHYYRVAQKKLYIFQHTISLEPFKIKCNGFRQNVPRVSGNKKYVVVFM